MGSSLLPPYRKPLVPGSCLIQTLDPDAQAFFTAAGITDATQKQAVNTLVLDLKAASIWTPMLALYPFVGGAATPHSFNLKNPATFQITWSGTVTHDANGITGNGSDGKGDTDFNVVDDGTVDSLAFGVYSRTNSQSTSRDIGTQETSAQNCAMFLRFTDDGGYFDNTETPGRCSGVVLDSRGLFTSSRTAGNAHSGYRNGSSIASTTNAQGTLPTIGRTFAVAAGAAGGGMTFSSRNLAFAFIATGLTAQNVSDAYDAVQAMQTTLGRQV